MQETHKHIQTEGPFLHKVGRVQWRCDQNTHTHTHTHTLTQREREMRRRRRRRTGNEAREGNRNRKWRLVKMSGWRGPEQSRSQMPKQKQLKFEQLTGLDRRGELTRCFTSACRVRCRFHKDLECWKFEILWNLLGVDYISCGWCCCVDGSG